MVDTSDKDESASSTEAYTADYHPTDIVKSQRSTGPVGKGLTPQTALEHHFNDDVDQSPGAHHHTIGGGPNNVPPGNIMDYVTSEDGSVTLVRTGRFYLDLSAPGMEPPADWRSTYVGDNILPVGYNYQVADIYNSAVGGYNYGDPTVGHVDAGTPTDFIFDQDGLFDVSVDLSSYPTLHTDGYAGTQYYAAASVGDYGTNTSAVAKVNGNTEIDGQDHSSVTSFYPVGHILRVYLYSDLAVIKTFRVNLVVRRIY